jgi:hypothetical protein
MILKAERHVDGGFVEGFEDRFESAGFVCFEGLEAGEAALVHGTDAAGIDASYQFVFGVEVVIHSSEVYFGVAGNLPQGGGFDAVEGEETFGGVENSILSLSNVCFIHTFV